MNEYLDIILRSCAVYIFIILAIRLFGKKELAQLSVIDLVLIMLISNSVQNAMVGSNSSLLGGMAAAATLFLLNYLLKLILYRSEKAGKILQGEPVLLVHNGKVLNKKLEKEKLSMHELEAAAREHGVSSLDEVNLAVLETDGTISILSKEYHHRTNRKRKHAKTLPTSN